MKTIFAIITITLSFVISVQGQSLRKVYGYVKNSYGQPVENVKVTSQEKFSKTLSDSKGWYLLEVPATDTILSFIHSEYKNFTWKHTETSRVDVIIHPKKEARVNVHNMDMAEESIYAMPVGGVAKKSGRTMFFSVGAGVQPPNWNTENYATIHENGFRNVLANPLSTFSIDVDNASYSNVRRYINQGELPLVDAVRIEEMINYFNYDYPEPTGEHPFSVSTELAECPWNSNHYLMHVGLKGKSIDKSELPPSNLVFLLDVSGSMGAPNKLPLLKRAYKMLVNELRPNDRVAIVVYAGAAGKVLDSTPGNEKKTIIKALENLSASGSTAGGEGLKLAYKIARENFIKNGNNRIILATDGDFNVGVSSTSEMERLVEKERESGIFMTVLGFGMGNIKDDKMETIADKGNGNYAYIDNIQEARKVFITEFGGTLFTIAKDVKFQLEFNPENVKAYRLVGYENRLLNAEDFNDDTKDAGEMGAGHTVTALYEIIPTGSGENAPSVDPLKYQNSEPVSGKVSKELLTVKLRYKAPDGNKSKLLEQVVKNNLAAKTSDNFRFSASVASFGMLLRGSEFMGKSTIKSILDLAKDAKGIDEEGYRSEFIQLVKTVNDLQFFSEE
ncbi:MAG: VWA domain-containing protein [Prolixibacteraceae bacterium]|jgi:Ca-activated chloride channel homolog|nr:VWA domain-containing protein [Prolixibacteraceae bacterium]MBT6007067.1 VWA domain-containing protein [Prolixibacteraceae bacterium]MBT6765329.1 VWA domain-containing protein [Prolixibacteraceae bacterium]MBT6997056.1 VWA domain-containing protein [Prolixibacteraceae bacterium]MBT7396059.1 VWA domain-containing protein [Prolixibacteraceae bacterium]